MVVWKPGDFRLGTLFLRLSPVTGEQKLTFGGTGANTTGSVNTFTICYVMIFMNWYTRILISFWILVMTSFWAMPVSAKVFYNKEDALRLAFPDAGEVERKTIFLTDEEVIRIEALSRSKLDSKIFTYYVGIGEDGVSGYAFLGSRIIRTKPAVYMIVINQTGFIRQVEILAFYEPEEYLPAKKWFDQFENKLLDERLRPNRGIIAVSGATLSVNGITSEVRKVLSVFEIKILKGNVR